MAFTVYHQVIENGVFKNPSAVAKYRVFQSGATLKVSETSMTAVHATNFPGFFYATITPSSWADGQYLVHTYNDGKSNKPNKSQFYTITVQDDAIISVDNQADIATFGGTQALDSTVAKDATVAKEATLGTPADTDLATDIANAAGTQALDATVAKEATLGTPADTDIATDIANAAASQALDSTVAKEATIGTPADTDIATDIANVVSHGDLNWGSSGTDEYTMAIACVTSGSSKYFAAAIYKNGQIQTGATNLALTIARRTGSGNPVTEDTISIASPRSDGIFDTTIFTPTSGNMYSAKGTVDIDGYTRNVGSFFWVV